MASTMLLTDGYEKAPQVGLEPTTLRLTVTLEDFKSEFAFSEGYRPNGRR
jgi:hypothetical protein